MGFVKVLVSFLAFCTLSGALLVRVAHQASEREQLVVFGEAMLAAAAASQGVGDPAQALALLRRHGGDAPVVRAKLGRSLPVTAAELAKLEPERLWNHLAHKLIDPLYEASLYDFLSGFPASGRHTTPLPLELKKTSFRTIHETMGTALLTGTIVTLLLLALRFLLSEGAKRFLSVGIIVTLATLPALLLQTIAGVALERASVMAAGSASSYATIIRQELLGPLADLVQSTYLPVFIVGAIMLATGLVIHFTVKSNENVKRL